jgi:hypothetical protein
MHKCGAIINQEGPASELPLSMSQPMSFITTFALPRALSASLSSATPFMARMLPERRLKVSAELPKTVGSALRVRRDAQECRMHPRRTVLPADRQEKILAKGETDDQGMIQSPRAKVQFCGQLLRYQDMYRELRSLLREE